MTAKRERLARMYESHGDKLRFLVVGAFNTAFGYVLFVTMLAIVRLVLGALGNAGVSVPPIVQDNYFLIAQWTSWVMAVPVGALTLKHFVFKSRGPVLGEIARAYLVYLPGLVMSSAILTFAVHVLGLTPAVGQLLTIAIVTVFSYLGHKYFTFRTGADD